MSRRSASHRRRASLRFAIAACSAALAASSALAAASDAPPPARQADVVEQVFGKTLHDPYRWMEGEKNAEFQKWLAAQGDYTRGKLDALPTLQAWQETLRKTSGNEVVYRAQRYIGGRLFFIRQEGQGTGTLMVREADGKERVLLDPATLAGEGSHASITLYVPSPDGSKVAVDTDRGGAEVTRLEVFDVQSGKPTGDAMEPVWGEFGADWLPDGSGFAYTQMAPPDQRTNGDPIQDMRLRFHRLGTPAQQDPILLRAGTGEGSNPSFAIPSNRFPEIEFPTGSRWALARATGAQPETRYCVAPQAEAIKPGASWRCMTELADKVEAAAIHGDTLYLVSSRKHSNGEVLAIDLSRADASIAQARSVLPLDDDQIIVGLSLADTQELAAARDALYVKVSKNGIDGIRRIDYASGKADAIAMPLPGSSSLFHADSHQDGFLLGLRGWTTPVKAWRYDAKDRSLHTLGQDQSSPADYSMVEVTETELTSKDGTRIPLTILHRKDAVLDGSHRAILWGYGSYGLSQVPTFNPVRLEWVKHGNVFAYAHVRGGGEKGEAWHLAGKGPNKHKGVEDFVGSVEALSKLGYSRPERTGLISGSAGGLLVGGAVVNYPKAFGAAVFRVALLNPVRLMHAPNGANQVGEMGDPRKADEFPFILAMDPYQNIKPHTAYPAVMMNVGLNDSRVAPWETGKFAAKLRAANTGSKPIWIRTNANGGHGIQVSLGAEATEFADIYAFLDAQLPTP
ncbi:prolyl oligopeptidase family serine peptidase [Dyella sp. LX-66]|uniref:prolyl oligopeptidase family serine peptidase n=1 Tax=unclassified Dyella TaxID=2634549 RepID=UPI001BE0503B|nr:MULTISPECIES: prolyl oligopeptidase family serine peptidase [unclassified Dyella]MBT2117395.1 prolyl oligopeptidase family serine peptidase [Dyella sp. LX-1]MBT2138459.1 prolyl oligopeptidase family serine peptidase [Dyella sp. LX-66]